ncbi:MAG: redox-regulated ATPase YchF [Candidatus Altiarchaeales archaeon]|nr:redox-regulated ATPase YchF [Candidatus Altiarchaeales archaeon]MBD3416919.1 redox-regulated ATPase YchF [Candidatus Altiarchaeales archaeon]
MEVGIVGKPNVGKSTLFKSLTLADTEIAAFPFTTIKANIGVGYVRSRCPCASRGRACNPNNSICKAGERFTPVKVIDVAGLVPGAHEGRGLGNQFLDDLRQADVLIHVVDISGRTDDKGEPTEGHDPEEDIRFLEDEVNLWFAAIVKRNWATVKNRIKYERKKLIAELMNVLSGLGVGEKHVKESIDAAGLSGESEWSEEDCERFAIALREISKPILVAANKIDLGRDNYERLKGEYDMVPVCAEAELALREADIHGLIEYTPGDGEFKIVGEIDDKRAKALEFIRERILKAYGNTGVQDTLNKAVYDILGLITVYPVENEGKLEDGKGNVLPDSYLMPEGSTALDLAYRIHTDIGEKFIGAIDCNTKMKVGKDHQLKDCDVIKIISGR